MLECPMAKAAAVKMPLEASAARGCELRAGSPLFSKSVSRVAQRLACDSTSFEAQSLHG
jgi:hypothetical protein